MPFLKLHRCVGEMEHAGGHSTFLSEERGTWEERKCTCELCILKHGAVTRVRQLTHTVPGASHFSYSYCCPVLGLEILQTGISCGITPPSSTHSGHVCSSLAAGIMPVQCPQDRGTPKQHYAPIYSAFVWSARRTSISSAPLTETGLS